MVPFTLGLDKLAHLLQGALSKDMAHPAYLSNPHHGALRNYSIEDIKGLVKQLLHAGYLELVEGEFPTLQVTAIGHEALRTREVLAIRLPAGDRPPVPSRDQVREATSLLDALAELNAEMRRQRAIVEAMPEFQRLAELEQQHAETAEQLKEVLEATAGVIATASGKVGFQVRRTVKYDPAALRELAPEVAPLVVTEAVDKTKLTKLMPRLVREGKAPESLLDDLEASAEVKVATSWVFSLATGDEAAEPDVGQVAF